MKKYLPSPFFLILVVLFSLLFWDRYGKPIPADFVAADFFNSHPVLQGLYTPLCVIILLAIVVPILYGFIRYDEWRKS